MAHYCNEHKTPFFKKGKMRGYAHPILDADSNDTGEWCNEPEGRTETQEAPKKQWTPSGKSPEERISIERQKSADIAFSTAWASESTTDCLEKAERIYQWIHTGVDVKEVINESLKQMGLVIPEEAKPLKPTVAVVKDTADATEQQIDTLKSYENKHHKVQELMDKHGFKKKLTKANADILIDEFVLLEDAKND